MNFNELRGEHPQFIYEGFQILEEGKNLKVTFDFLITPDIRFKPEIIFPNVSRKEGLENLVFNLGMIELISYWKAACPPEIIIKAGYLDEVQISFWKNLLIKGLGEFFYTNQIDFTINDLVHFVILNEVKDLPRMRDSNELRDSSPAKPVQNDKIELTDRDLILVGGGKDSAVTLEQISNSGKDFNCLILNPTKAALDIAQAGGCKNPIIIKRTIDTKLLELNKMGYLNGHTPFSAYLAFLGTLAGVLYDYQNIVVSNEASSNEGNVRWMGQEINHQYSKTSEFEKDFRDYCEKYLAPTNYFSYLRSKGELEISELFSKMEKYHKLFRSCNKGSKQGIWCGECPKCISTFITLYPYLGEKTVEIFGKNLLKDEKLKPVIEGLLGKNNLVKPFECVATYGEIKKALGMVGYET